MAKYELVPAQLLHEGTLEEKDFFTPLPMVPEVISRAHHIDYIEKLNKGTLSTQEVRRIGFPYSLELIRREEMIMHGTVQAALFALDDGIAFNAAGGTHHSYADHGEGFCLYNDVAIAALHLISIGKVKRPLVVDLDVHQGNGTAKIFEENDAVFTFSMHGAKNFPAHKEISDLDVPLEDGCDDATYLKLLDQHLPQVIEKHKPDFIFYIPGVDVLVTDKLGRLGLSRAGCKARDRYVLESAKSHGLPVCASLGGGYSTNLTDIVEAHCNTFRLGAQLY